METKVKENGTAVNGEKQAVKGAAFINGNPVNKEGAKPQEAKSEEVKKEGVCKVNCVKACYNKSKIILSGNQMASF